MTQITTKFDYAGKPVRAWSDETLSLTDMWRAAGGDETGRPAAWLRSADATKFIAALTEVVSVRNSHTGPLVIKTIGGKNPDTRAHWQIGLAYAKYLSPEFHIWCNTVVRDQMEGRVNTPGRKVTLRDVGGVVKAVTHKELMESEERYRAELALLKAELAKIAEAYDPTRTVSIMYRLANHYVIQAGVGQKGRRGFTTKCSNRLLKFAGREIPDQPGKNRMHLARTSNESGKWTFHLDLWREWLVVEGNTLIREHKDAQSGQSVLQLVSPKKPV